MKIKLLCVVLLVGFITSCIGQNDTSNIPITSVTILIDNTDGFSKEQRVRLTHSLTVLRNNLNAKDKLTIYEVAGSYQNMSEFSPIYSEVIPNDPDNCNEYFETCSQVQKSYDASQTNFLDAINRIEFSKTYENSYILESIQMIITDKNFQSFEKKKLVIFSNMLQNSQSVNHYGNYDSVSNLKEDLYIFNVAGSLMNANVDINMLPDKRNEHNQRLRAWWNDYFQLAGTNNVNTRTF